MEKGTLRCGEDAEGGREWVVKTLDGAGGRRRKWAGRKEGRMMIKRREKNVRETNVGK